jgi:hypothetical protein
MRGGIRLLAVLFVGLLASAALLAQAASAPVNVNPSATKGKAGAPPPSSATTGTSIGSGKASVNTANAAGDTDSMWAEKIDIDGDGNIDDAQALWDDEDKVLYYSKTGTFSCSNGGTGSGGMLVAVFAEGNAYGRPANSGWWVAEVDKDECKAQASGLVGCKFDGSGANTACGVATINAKTDDVVIVAVKR